MKLLPAIFLAILALLTMANVTQAAPPCVYGLLEAPLPGLEGKCVDEIANQEKPLTSYAGTLINYFIALIVGISLVMIVFAGYLYMTAAGDNGRVGSAKTMIQAALVGMALALASFTLLQFLGGDQFFAEPKFGNPPTNSGGTGSGAGGGANNTGASSAGQSAGKLAP